MTERCTVETEMYDILQGEILPALLTGCLSQQSLMTGRIFLCTTTSCRSSREGCWPISSSNGSMYSPTVPENQQFKKKERHYTAQLVEKPTMSTLNCQCRSDGFPRTKKKQNKKQKCLCLLGQPEAQRPFTCGPAGIPAPFDSPSTSVQRDTSSHSTKPMAYMSILRKESRWKLMAPSSTSGAM